MKKEKKKKTPGRSRYIFFSLFFIAASIFFIARFIYLQITYKSDFSSNNDLVITTENVRAVRGEIYDRNGKLLVSNEYTYDCIFDKNSFPSKNEEMNETIKNTLAFLENRKDTLFPVELKDGKFVFSFGEEEKKQSEFKRMSEFFKLEENTDCDSFISFLENRYSLFDEDGKRIYGQEEEFGILSVRYELERIGFNPFEPYIISENVSTSVINAINEAKLQGVRTQKNTNRVLNYPGYCSHFLGRIGKIPAEELDYYKEKGYPMDAYVGTDGVEKAFEEYLHGKDGTLVTVEDKNGNVVDQYYKVEPQPGKDVYLTIDIDLQIAAEDTLAYNITYIRDKANSAIYLEKMKYTDEEGNVAPWANLPSLIGEDVKAGAATAIDPNNGEVLALASNPTFDLSEYSSNYAELSADESKPLYNRALMGIYEPGSTFKVGVAATALQTGLITRYDTIYDRGVYAYYPDYQPECWIWTSHHYTHGAQNVVSAIQNSCNYFFYDVGRRLTIERMNEYSAYFGLGQHTGIELAENTGVLAGPAYAASIDRTWVPGDTIQAAIGQSDNLFTPLQLSVYLSTILNGGTRYKAHILKCVREYGKDGDFYTVQPEIVSQTSISPEHIATLKEAMKRVTENGTASSVFARYPIEMGGKTGTAQVGKTKSQNGIFIAFAPYETPEIAVSCVIEQAGGSNDVSVTIKGILNQYFHLN